MWSLRDALNLCIIVEQAVSTVGWHTGLTGGCLYKDGYRKDLDLVLYPHTSSPGDVNKLLDKLKAAGFTMKEIFSSVVKASYDSKAVDLFVVDRVDLWDDTCKGALGSRWTRSSRSGGDY